MSWFLAAALALGSFFAIVWLRKPPRRGWEAAGAALLLGLAGYGLQGNPGMQGAPKQPPAPDAGLSAAMVEERTALSGSGTMPGDNWVVIADAMARHGRFADAATMLLGAVEHSPGNGEAWLAMANALVGHSEGILTPAALYAFRRAGEAAPNHPGPAFFLGMAMAQSGRFVEARQLWAQLLASTPPDAPWREDLEFRLGRLDTLIASQEDLGNGNQ